MKFVLLFDQFQASYSEFAVDRLGLCTASKCDGHATAQFLKDLAVAGKLKAISAPSRFTPAAMRMAWS